MRYGLLGQKLPHTVSPQIHALLGIENYEKIEREENELPALFQSNAFDGFNVTIPYKEKVIPYLFALDRQAKTIGAVNTVVRTENGYVGYNTDVDGMAYALKKAGIDPQGKNVLILGTGGTSKTATYLAEKENARSVTKVGRRSEVNYENVYDRSETQVIVNTTPVGMFPNVNEKPLDLSRFPNLSGVFDCIYNPKTTLLIEQAKRLGVPCANGLLMLIEQARKAEEYFLQKPLPETLTDQVAESLLF